MLSKHDFHVSLGRTARFGGHFSQHPFTTGCGNISYSICLQLAGSLKVKHLTSVPAGGVCPLDWTGIDKQACLACCLVPNLTWTRTLKQNLKADVLKKKKKKQTQETTYTAWLYKVPTQAEPSMVEESRGREEAVTEGLRLASGLCCAVSWFRWLHRCGHCVKIQWLPAYDLHAFLNEQYLQFKTFTN